MLKRAIGVGASSGIGASLVRMLAQNGYLVAAVARREDRLQSLCEELNRGAQRVWAFTHDVTESNNAAGIFSDIVRTLDGVDLVVYSAGVMPRIGDDEYDSEADRTVIEVNVMGAITWLNLAAERFQIQRGGTIVGIGSVAGDRGRRGNPVYCASKAALHTYLEALRNRLSQHNVSVVTIKPGPVRTPMTDGLEKLPMVIDVDVAAKKIFKAITQGGGTSYVPIQWAPIMAVIRSIPSVVFRRMSI